MRSLYFGVMKDPCFAYAEGNWMGSLEIIHFEKGEGSLGVSQIV